MTKEEMMADIKSRGGEFYAEQLKLRYEGQRQLCQHCALVMTQLEEIKDECSDCIAYKLAYYRPTLLLGLEGKQDVLTANYGLYLDSPDRPFIPPRKTDRPRMTPEEMIEDIKGRYIDSQQRYTSHWTENDEQLCEWCRLIAVCPENAQEIFREECPDCLTYKQMGITRAVLSGKDIFVPVTSAMNID
jgi:hypothetical protein